MNDTLGRKGVGSPKITTSRRTIKLPKLTVGALREHRRNGSDFVFSTSKGTAINVCNLRNRVWQPLLIKAGLPTHTHIHTLRHSAITLLLSNCMPVNVVADMAGHGDPAITLSIYGHVLQGMQDVASDTIDEILG